MKKTFPCTTFSVPAGKSGPVVAPTRDCDRLHGQRPAPGSPPSHPCIGHILACNERIIYMISGNSLPE
ncbi:hypothetical protein ASZ90_016032 [hydrocarbon metagenome]|uniref:Uncharacterized protein n=1 Tax=hydrocarbon metagenome TaxID=938273 RepID=A0A0W8F1V6_9ZZZZ